MNIPSFGPLDLALSGQMTGGNDQSVTSVSPTVTNTFSPSHVVNDNGTAFRQPVSQTLIWIAVAGFLTLLVFRLTRK